GKRGLGNKLFQFMFGEVILQDAPTSYLYYFIEVHPWIQTGPINVIYKSFH
ncbi:hypothetical protein ACJX0J_019769, partial [Zea mays]